MASQTIARVWKRIIDGYTYYAFKKTWTSSASQKPIVAPGWIREMDRRRLYAYGMLEAYYRNAGRLWVNPDAEEEDRESRREYGDPYLLVNQTLSSLIGDKITFQVKDAQATDNQLANSTHELLEKWWEDDLFEQKLIENERNAIKLGDGVMTVTWDEEKQRPVINIYNPGFYFPVLDPRAKTGENFPNTVHIAWEFEEEVDGKDVNRVRRITWRMMEYEDGQTRPLAYGGTSKRTCYYSDGVWDIDNLGNDPDLFDEGKAEWLVEPMDLLIDFLPVVHVPNLVSLEEHFGTSLLANVMQILDDLVATDTDLSKAAATTGAPPIAVSGAAVTTATTYGPGTLFSVGDGKIDVIDTSRALDALIKAQDTHLKRLSVNARIPESLLGRVKPNEVPSGIALTLSFTPHSSLIGEMRLVRRQKYGLILKFVQRLFVANNLLDAVVPAEIVFGSFLPADKQEVMTMVAQLLPIGAISLETAVNMMVMAGFPIDDALLEIERIRQNDVTRAQSIVSLTGDINEGRKAIGLPPDPTMTNIFDQPAPDPNAPPA